ncbi:hypothetical protein J2X77_003770 [Sphingobacterium sp. 2149]|uniref:Uncharacterized protein n=1 Tax=Sphingobacterium zeae TaxID=1776859 RepID=A0ABU0U0W8_9SPHI|nr:hypothetical protein [Sphingobacterium zeae]MDR6736894.1 hypothetical protein [Sphingobacterium sp. 2149]
MFVGYLLKERELGFQIDNNAIAGNIVLYLY